ncbi:hypothetical protein N9Y47_04860 [Flavobacteriaceae bacterium]|jgi:hypothetical protein|nr:hypothetical protein [Flavobacteriaceae bacterium]MBT4313922.1 hypothetical protein [Flavobacteriaceae bacterium]MBT5091072.1 hypothetical protein [Flavobacteriaceae bacterium]MBT5282659.1 hypothetical protein [Flavobacteriaceae bacterium]MBT5446927.1 hypothetical protein [Flavobacteriaceae bacterium]
MNSFLNKFKFIFLLIPVGLFIAFLDGKILQGFLASNQIPDHYLFIGSLVLVVMGIIFAILRFDNKNE